MEEQRDFFNYFEPQNLDEFVGQAQLLKKNASIKNFILNKTPFNFILNGPPGCGKTSFAKLLAKLYGAESEYITAVSAGVPEMKKLVAKYEGKFFFLIVDEVHRFTKVQQDFLLPLLENRKMCFIGLTTENPYAALTPAIRSRCFSFRFFKLEPYEIEKILLQGLNKAGEPYNLPIVKKIAEVASGDARIAINALIWILEAGLQDTTDTKAIEEIIRDVPVSKDQSQEHYELASAFIKSIRGSDPNAALYYMAKMLELGDDPLFITRRMMILASEDIGLANPNALGIAVAAHQAYIAIGPEANLCLAEAVIYLACCEKNNSVNMALEASKKLAGETLNADSPLHLKNSEKGQQLYKYPHNFPGGWVQQQYLPNGLENNQLYVAKDIGYEKVLSNYINGLKARAKEQKK